VSKFVSIGLFCRPLAAKNPNFCHSAFSDVDNWQQFEKIEHGCTTTNLLSNGIKIVSVLQCLHGKIKRTNSGVQKREGQKSANDGQENLFFAAPAAGEI